MCVIIFSDTTVNGTGRPISAAAATIDAEAGSATGRARGRASGRGASRSRTAGHPAGRPASAHLGRDRRVRVRASASGHGHGRGRGRARGGRASRRGAARRGARRLFRRRAPGTARSSRPPSNQAPCTAASCPRRRSTLFLPSHRGRRDQARGSKTSWFRARSSEASRPPCPARAPRRRAGCEAPCSRLASRGHPRKPSTLFAALKARSGNPSTATAPRACPPSPPRGRRTREARRTPPRASCASSPAVH